MVEINQFVVQQQLARRGTGTRAAGRGAQLQGIRGAPTGQGLGEVGRGLQVLGQTLARTEFQFERAKAGVLSTEALIGFLNELQQTESEIMADTSIFPTDRAATLRERLEPRIQEIQDTLPVIGQESFLRGAQSTFLRVERSMKTAGREEARARGRQSIEEALTRLGQDILTVDNDTDQQIILGTVRELVTQGVAQGFLTEAEGLGRLRQFRHDTAMAEAEMMIRQDPEAMVEQLMLGPEANPGIPPDQLPGLIDTAQQERREQLNFAEQQERIEEAQAKDVADARYREELNDLYALVEQQAEAPAIQAWMQTFRTRQEEFGDNFARGLSIAASFLEASRRAKREIQVDPVTLSTLVNGLYGPEKHMDATDVAAMVTAGTIDPVTHGIRFYSDLQERSQENNFSRVWEFNRGFSMLQEAVTGIVGPLDQLLNAQNAASLQRWLEAQTLYINAARTLQRQGATPEEGRRFVEERILSVARDLINHYATQFRALQLNQLPLLPFGLEKVFQEEGINAAKDRLRTLRERPGNPIDETVFRDLMRNLKRRNELGWRGGEEERPDAPTPQENTNQTFQQSFLKALEGTP